MASVSPTGTTMDAFCFHGRIYINHNGHCRELTFARYRPSYFAMLHASVHWTRPYVRAPDVHADEVISLSILTVLLLGFLCVGGILTTMFLLEGPDVVPRSLLLSVVPSLLVFAGLTRWRLRHVHRQLPAARFSLAIGLPQRLPL